MRHMTASPEKGPVVLIYGCSECNWIYHPKTPEETSEKYLLMAQFKFEQHVCSTCGDQANVGLATHCRTLPIFASRLDSQRRILASAVPSHSPTTEELLKRAEDLIRQNQECREGFIAAMNRLLKRQAEFQAEHPPWGSRYS